MGCDIHVRIEKLEDSKWVNMPWKNPDRNKYSKDHNPDGTLEIPDYFDARNYNLFAVLANVRNGTWGVRIPPIDSPRGFPENSPIDIENGEYLGDHSFSYITLKELQDYNWDAPYIYRASVSPEQAKALREKGETPNSWAAWSSCGEQVEWKSTVREAVNNWPDDILPVLASIGNPDEVRLVFGFDS